MADDSEHKRGYRNIMRSISQVFTPTSKQTHTANSSSSSNINNNIIINSNNNNNKSGSVKPSLNVTQTPDDNCAQCQDARKVFTVIEGRKRTNSLFYNPTMIYNHPQTIVPVADIQRAKEIQEENELQQAQSTTALQRYKSVSSGNLTDLPGEDEKKSMGSRVRRKLNSNVFRINKSRNRRSQVNSLCLDEQTKYPLFGARLSLLELNMSDHPHVPRFVVDACAQIEKPEHIEQDGVYRASGNKLHIDELKQKLIHLYDPRWLQTDDIHTLTSLHKQFFRELPDPLITHEAYEQIGRSLTDDGAIERMHLAFDVMPEPNRSTLRFLIKHLTNVAAASGSNRMPASNLAIVWGPCLLAGNFIYFDIGRMNMLAKMLIEKYDLIFRPTNERLC